MKSRSTKKHADKVAAKATGRIGAFPYHRAGKIMQRKQEEQAAFQEQEAKKRQEKPSH